jgi:hypothetical protein
MVGVGKGPKSAESRGSRRAALARFMPLFALVSCDGDAGRTTFRDTGSACLGPGEGWLETCSLREVPADVPLEVSVDFDTCTSSSCDTVLSATCRASVSGSVITITAEAVVQSESGVCTNDCGSVAASCKLPALAAGTYELRYGLSSTALTVPSTTALACIGADREIRCCDTSADCGGGACEGNQCRSR